LTEKTFENQRIMIFGFFHAFKTLKNKTKTKK